MSDDTHITVKDGIIIEAWDRDGRILASYGTGGEREALEVAERRGVKCLRQDGTPIGPHVGAA